jgi:hypothetical protein
LEYTLATWGCNAMSSYCLGGWILLVAELDADVELTDGAET